MSCFQLADVLVGLGKLAVSLRASSLVGGGAIEGKIGKNAMLAHI